LAQAQRGDGFSNVLSNQFSARFVGVRQQNGEFLASITRGNISRSFDRGCDRRTDSPQAIVAGRMAVAIRRNATLSMRRGGFGKVVSRP
jgi:hypothetical protein